MLIDVATRHSAARRHHHPHHPPRHLVVTSSAIVLSAFLVGYFLLEKKLLPKRLWRPLSTFYFYPLMVPNLLVRMASGQPYFSDVDGGVMLGATPMLMAGHVQALHDDGVRAVVNLQAEYAGPVAAYRALHPPIEQLRIPVTDHVEPTVAQLEQAVAFIRLHRARGERVLVHCKGGHGRSAAVAMAWLISSEGLTPEEAQRRLSSVRHVRSSLDKQPAITTYYARHARGGTGQLVAAHRERG